MTRYYVVEVSDDEAKYAREALEEVESTFGAIVTEVHPGDRDVRSDGMVITETQAYVAMRMRDA